MANKKIKEQSDMPKAKPNSSTFSYDEYYATLMLAKKIRLENAEALSNAKTPKDKTQLLEQLFVQYNISSFDSKEKERAMLLRINIFIPDNEKFIEDYKTKFGKNVRLISEDYQVPAPFVFQKVMEIGKYEQFLNRIEQEGGLGEPELEPKTPTEVIGKLASSGALKPLYDTPIQSEKSVHKDITPTSKKGKERKKKENKNKVPETTPITASSNTQPSSPQLPTDDTSLSGIVSEELLQHLTIMQRYSTKLLNENEQLTKENSSLQRLNREFEALIKRLKQENEMLKAQNSSLSARVTTLTTEHDALEKQVSELTIENSTLKEQTNVTPAEIAPRSIAEETATEGKLRKEIKDLQFANQELQTQLKTEEDKKCHYRNRAVVAEAQLEQLQSGMQGIAEEVDALDLSFLEGIHKKG